MALVPEVVRKLSGGGHAVVVEVGAGEAAGIPDALFEEAGATFGDPWEAEVIARVVAPEDSSRLSGDSVLIASQELGRFFPMLMTAAGTIPPAQVLVLGAGVAGLQAIAKLITAEAVGRMGHGSVIVDLAGEAGGNCELARPGETKER